MLSRRFVRWLPWSACIAVCVAVAPTASAGLPITYEVVAMTGDAAPDVESGVQFDRFEAPIINNRGDVLFHASLAGEGITIDNDSGLWLYDQEGPRLIRREREPEPLLGENLRVKVGSPGSNRLNDAGDVLYFTSVSKDVKIGDALWRTTNGADSLLATTHVPMSSPTGMIQFDSLNASADFTLGPTTGAAFVASAQALENGQPTGQTLSGIWIETEQGPELIVPTGQTAPGAPPGTTFKAFDGLNVDDSGTIRFWAELVHEDTSSDAGEGIWAYRDGVLTPIVAPDQQAPGLQEGVVFRQDFPNERVVSELEAVKNGTLAFVAGVNRETDPLPWADRDTLWVAQDDQLTLVARSNETLPTPDGPGVISDRGQALAFGGESVNQHGDVAFGTHVYVSDRLLDGIWKYEDDGYELIAMRGQEAPGLAPGAVFGAGRVDVGHATINDRGDVVFQAVVDPDADGPEQSGFTWWVHANGQLQLILREGGVIDLDPTAGTDFRIVEGFETVLDGRRSYQDPMYRGLNDHGTMVFHVGFTDGTSAVVKAQLQVPGDFDLDGDVDAFDLGVWQNGFGTASMATPNDGDADGDGDVDAFDLGLWQLTFGSGVSAAVPEPGTVLTLGLIGLVGLQRPRRMRFCR